ncbi:hypothetical protein [Streptomyces mirabilis]|uniref:hypothetical protein n=1 Tax=Streptomyces mirabilis TaxID=68239 RepID=UPI003328DE47
MTETEELRAAVELPAAKVHALDIVVHGDRATGRGHAPHLRRDADAGRFWVFQVSANTWRWARTPQARRIAERVNADLDGTEGPRAMLAPPGPGPTGPPGPGPTGGVTSTDDPPRSLRRTFDDPSAIERTRCGEWLKT